MPRRMKTIDEQSPYGVLASRIDALEAQVRQLNAAQRSTIQTTDTVKHHDPVQGELVVHHPGTHVTATPTDPIQYFHNGEWRTVGPTHYSYVRLYDDGYVTVGNGTGEFILTFDSQYARPVENTDTDRFSIHDGWAIDINHAQGETGLYAIHGGALWRDVGGNGFPVGGYAQLQLANGSLAAHEDQALWAYVDTEFNFPMVVGRTMIIPWAPDDYGWGTRLWLSASQTATDGLTHDIYDHWFSIVYLGAIETS